MFMTVVIMLGKGMRITTCPPEGEIKPPHSDFTITQHG